MGRKKRNQGFPYITVLAVWDKKLLQLRYRPDVWAKLSLLISQAFIDNENSKERSWKIFVFSSFLDKGKNHME